MITETQYNILIKCKDSSQIFNNEPKAELSYLLKNQYLIPEMVWMDNDGYNGYQISNKGLLAIQEYEDRINGIQSQTRTLQIAEESNKIAKEANQIAREANAKSKKANSISVWSIVISAILSIGAVIASVLIALFVKS